MTADSSPSTVIVFWWKISEPFAQATGTPAEDRVEYAAWFTEAPAVVAVEEDP